MRMCRATKGETVNHNKSKMLDWSMPVECVYAFRHRAAALP